jgi:TonB family protein
LSAWNNFLLPVSNAVTVGTGYLKTEEFMFERLVESDSAAQFKPRRSYFMVSTVVVGILFLTAVVISLYAEEINIGAGDLEIVELIAPITAEAAEPPREPPPPASQSSNSSKLPVRNDFIARVDEVPKVTPTGVSSVPSKYMSRPPGDFILDPNARESNGSGPPVVASGSRGSCTVNCGGSSDFGHTAAGQSEEVFGPPPPPVRQSPPPVKTTIRTSKVLNGEAKFLPKPIYPPPAQAVRAEGNVNVQVLIDERGNVVSAKVIEGHPLLRAASVEAAKRAKFSPTLLSDVPVKVTGIIVYKFSRN